MKEGKWKRHLSLLLSFIMVLSMVTPAMEIKAAPLLLGEEAVSVSENAEEEEIIEEIVEEEQTEDDLSFTGELEEVYVSVSANKFSTGIDYASQKLSGAIVDIDTQWTQDRYEEVKEMLDKPSSVSANLTAWKNDKALSEIALITKDVELKNVAVSVNDLVMKTDGSKKIDASNITATFVKSTEAYNGYGTTGANTYHKEQGYLSLESNTGYPSKNDPNTNRSESSDILYQTEPMDIPENSVQPVWIAFEIPKGTEAGIYEGIITATADEVDTRLTFTYTIEVQDATLADATEFKNQFDIELWQYPYRSAEYYGVDPFSKEHFDILRSGMELYKEIGGNTITATILENAWGGVIHYDDDSDGDPDDDPKRDYPSMIKWIKTGENTFKWEYDHFDAWVEFCKEEIGIGDKILLFGIVPWNQQIGYWEDDELKYASLGWDVKKEFIQNLRQHLILNGWFDDAYIAVDEEKFDPAYKLNDELVRLLYSAYPDIKGNEPLKISVTTNSLFDVPNGWSGGAIRAAELGVAHYASDASQWMNGETYNLAKLLSDREALGYNTKLYLSTNTKPGTFSLSEPVESYWSVVYAGKMGTSGFQKRAYDAWVYDPLSDATHRFYEPGEFFLIYPDEKTEKSPTSKSSIRLERMAQGVRDVNKLLQIKKEVTSLSGRVDAVFNKISSTPWKGTDEQAGKYLDENVINGDGGLRDQTAAFKEMLNGLTVDYIDLKSENNESTFRIVQGEEINMTLGSKPYHLTTQLGLKNLNNKDIYWTSKDVSIASIESDGRVMAVAPGSTVITATLKADTSIKAQITITVKTEKIDDLKDARVSFYSFDHIKEGGSTIIDEWGDYDGELQNKATTVTLTGDRERFGRALSIEDAENDFMLVKVFESLKKDWTISCWVKTSSPIIEEISILEDKNDDSHLSLKIDEEDGYGFRRGNSKYEFGPSDTFKTGKWYHITWVRDQSLGLSMYIDGKIVVRGASDWEKQLKYYIYHLVGSSTVMTENPVQAPYQIIGGNGFTGLIDEVKIYKKALTPEQVMTLEVEQEINYNITFDSNDPVGETVSGNMLPQMVEKGVQEYLAPNQFNCSGYHFVGWNTRADGTGTYYKDKADMSELELGNARNLTLYAQWKENTKTSAPYANLVTGSTVIQGTTELVLACKDEDAKIYYTMNSTEDPTICKENEYTGPIPLPRGNITIRAMAWEDKPDTDTSNVVAWEYEVIPEYIVFDKNTEADVSGDMPNQYCEKDEITLTENQFQWEGYHFVGWNTKANGTGDGYSVGDKVTRDDLLEKGGSLTLYAQWQVSTPYTELTETDVNKGTEVELLCKSTDALIYYTTNGTEPTNIDKSKVYNNKPVVINKDTTIKVVAVKAGCINSEVLELNYVVVDDRVVFDKNSTDSQTTGEMEPQIFGIENEIKLNQNKFQWPGYIFKGWNTSDDGEGTDYKDGATVSKNDLKGKATLKLFAQWQASTPTYELLEDELSEGIVSAGTKLQLSCSGNEAEIRYTTDGSQPTKDSTLYEEPISIEDTMTIRAIAVREGCQNSEELTLSYKVLTITFDKNGADVTGNMEDQKVKKDALLNKNQFERVDYRFTGWNTNAGGNGGKTYDDKHNINDIVSEIDWGEDAAITLYAQWTPIGQTIAPDANLASGSIVTEGTELELYAEEGATIYYTMDGKDPTEESTVYDKPIILTENVTIKAVALKEGDYKISEVRSWSYVVLKEGSHIIYFEKGILKDVVGVEGEMPEQIVDAKPIELLRENKFKHKDYIFTGWNTKEDGSGDKYEDRNGAILIDFKDELSITLYAQWERISKVFTPYANIVSDSVVEKDTKVTLSCAEEGAKIYYTMDGTIPTKKSTLYADPIVITENVKIKAIAVKESYDDSDILELSYEVVEKGVAYIITFDKNSEEAIGEMPQQSLMKNGFTILGKNAYQREGYLFTGWNTKANADESGTSYRDKAVLFGSNMKTESPITLYAQWVPMKQLSAPYAKLSAPHEKDGTGSIVRKGTEVELLHEDSGVEIFYTIVQDENKHIMPNKESKRYTDPIIIDRHMDIIVYTMKEDCIASEPVMFSYRVAETGEVYFEDIPEDKVIPEGLWVAGIDSNGYTYTGKAIKPEIRVYDYTTLLKVKTDYTVSYTRNVKVNDASEAKKAPTITVNGRGNYKGKATKVFKINPKDISVSENNISIYDITLAYNSKKVQKPVPVVYDNGKKIANKRDYTVEYVGLDSGQATFKDEGNYKIRISGKGNYTGVREINFLITNDNLISKASVSKIKDQTYDGGNPVIPKVPIVVKFKGKQLVENTDYEVVYENNKEIGKATAIIRGKEGSSYKGEKRVTFKIVGTPLKKVKFEATLAKTVTYTGKEITYKEAITSDLEKIFKKDNTYLKEGTDYTITYQKNIKAGKATIVFTGIGGYSGTIKKTFKITPYEISV